MANMAFPAVPQALLEHLKKSFQDTVPTNKQTSLDEFRYLQGQLSVIALLQAQYDKQNTSVLEK